MGRSIIAIGSVRNSISGPFAQFAAKNSGPLCLGVFVFYDA